MNDEVQKAFDQLKTDVVAETSASVEEKMKSVVSTEVIKALEEANKANKQPTKADMAANDLKYFKAVYNKDIKGEVTDDLAFGKKDLDTTTDGSGDELVPDGFGSEVIRIAQKVGVARQNSRVIQLPTKIYTLPTMGDATGYRIDEKAVITASSPVTGGITFTAKKLAGMVIATKECIEDANVDVMNWIGTLLAEAIAKKEDEWAFLGLAGTEGIFRNASVPVLTLGSGDVTFAASNLDDVLAGLSLISDDVEGNQKLLMSRSMLNHFRGLKDTYGQYLLQTPAAVMPSQIWDTPYILSSVMPKTSDNSQADAPFMAAYDPRYLMIGDRRTLSLEFSKDATVTSSDGSTKIDLFSQDMVAIKVTERIDIQLAQADKAFVRYETAAS
jgi:HK97 family phage major capsid protein